VSHLNPVLRRLAAPLGAVVVVVVVIVLLIWINGKPSGKGPGAGVIAAPTLTSSPIATAPVTTAAVQPTNNPATAVVHTPSTHPSAAVTPTATKTVHIGNARPTRIAMAPVVVLNNSTIHGLAASVAAELRAKGWHIESVGNLQGRTPTTTVYYATGERAEAIRLAHEFPSISSIRSAASADIMSHGSDLTLVVTRYWT
jgi:hypothetical protein